MFGLACRLVGAAEIKVGEGAEAQPADEAACNGRQMLPA